MTFFTYFPKISYKVSNSTFSSTQPIRDITLRVKIFDTLPQDDPYLYFDYTVKENERPEDVANFYYESVNYTWLVYLSNDIIDPFTQWQKPQYDFNNFIRKKYANSAGNSDPITWAQNTLISNNIIHYRNSSNNDLIVSPDTYIYAQTFNGDFVAGDWEAVRVYDYEMDINESYRNIRLLNEKYAATAEKNLRRLLNE